MKGDLLFKPKFSQSFIKEKKTIILSISTEARIGVLGIAHPMQT